MISYVNSIHQEANLKEDELVHHFLDNSVPYFGVKGIIVTKEAAKQESVVNRNDKNLEAM